MCTSGSKVMRKIGTFGPIKTICNSRLPQALMANEIMSNVKEPGCKRNMYPENKCTSRSVLSHVSRPVSMFCTVMTGQWCDDGTGRESGQTEG